MPRTAHVTIKKRGSEGRRIGPKGDDEAVLAIPAAPIPLDRFVPITSLRSLYHLVHIQKWEGLMVPHDAHTRAAERGTFPYAEYVQAATFAKVTGEMKHPETGQMVPCAVLNLRMPNATYGGQLWWVIGGHNIPHENSQQGHDAYRPCVSSLGGTLSKEAAEEALVIRDGDTAAIPFNPRARRAGRRLKVLGYGRSSDRVGRVHASALVAIHLSRGERLVVRDPNESLGFMRVPLAEWLRFMTGKETTADQALIRETIMSALEDELARSLECERAKRRALVDGQLTRFFGPNHARGERTRFNLTPERNTPPIDRLSLSAMQELAGCWGLFAPPS